jgi:hypothetical protein
VWQDEFDYPDAGLDERWVSQNGPSTHILSSRWRENAVVSNGTLKLINRKENRGGQAWTSGSIWTKERFQYGYFECRYRYAAATGTNNSFWIMTNTDGEPKTGKRFEIDINEGHYPNQVATNIHNHSDVTTTKEGKKTHPSASRVFTFGNEPGRTIQLEIPVTATKVRFSSHEGKHFHVKEFRIWGTSKTGYPEVMSGKADGEKPGVVNFVREAGTKISCSGVYKADGSADAGRMADGNLDTGWITQEQGEKWAEFDLGGPRVVGCVQFVTGWREGSTWRGVVGDYKVEYFDGVKWIEMSSFDQMHGEFNFARDFHVLGLDWTEKELVFYLDGKELRREKNEFCHSPAPVWLSLAIIPWAGQVTDAIDGTQMEVDYVRVFRRKR